MRYVRVLVPALLLFGAAALVGCHSPGQNSVIPVYGMGDRVPVGRVIYTVFDTRWMPQLDTGVLPRIPKNRFFLVRISVLNGGNREVAVPTLTVTDDKGQKYQELTDGEGVPEWLGAIRRVRPADTLSGNVVFDVTPQNYQLEATDEEQEKKAIIKIPLSFAGEAPMEFPDVNITPQVPTPQSPPQ